VWRQLERAFAQADQDAQWELTPDERKAIAQLSCDLPGIWNAATTTTRIGNVFCKWQWIPCNWMEYICPGQIELQIRWRSAMVSTLIVKRPVQSEWSLKTPEQAVSRIHSLAGRQPPGHSRAA
jgi:hypothetical protein